jgi:SMODS-associated and fused to various effectors sensor domain
MAQWRTSPIRRTQLMLTEAVTACAFAQTVRERLGEIIKSHRISHTRLFFYGPLALAIFLGQQLTSVGEIELLEYQNPGYVPSCTLRT